MTKIVELQINNYRGINSFYQRFDRDVICLVGRGDSGKTTILEAIKSVLSPVWNLSFYDTDFYNLNADQPIEIIASLSHVPEKLLLEEKYGLWCRTLCRETGVVIDDISAGDISVLTIKLTVDKALEPKWTVLNGRREDEIRISAGDRSKLNCFMISDFIDSHFSWNKGNPLNSLLKLHDVSADKEKIVLDAIREAKEKVDRADYAHFSGVTEAIKRQAASLGLNLDGVQTTLDFKDISLKEGKVSLHRGDVPFRLMGKGSKRLASMAIQTAISRDGGIALIDEIEQGLEPDRVKQVARTLKDENDGQVIITTHSREVAIELEAQDLLVVNTNRATGEVNSNFLDLNDSQLQGAIRACPEAFFSKKVIICEGATEVGVCRALDIYRLRVGKGPMCISDCSFVDGSGHSFTERALNTASAGLIVSVLCDSDVDGELNPSKEHLRASGVQIFDSDDGNSFEDQVFDDLPWAGILDLLNYVTEVHQKTEDSLMNSVRAKYDGEFPENWKEMDTEKMREAIAKASVVKKKEWFKSVGHGEQLGHIIFRYFEEIKTTSLYQTLSKLDNWID
ncbi:MAG: ATP-binding protein [Paraglaciecola sp.]|uniref:ATP-dependent nuclease n=2 Tax=Paraglaciecola sp. TaxID=1920173 RepID=UPI00326447F4